MAETEHEPDQPEQGDQATGDAVPLPPWAKPSPEARAEARPAKEALEHALREIKTPEQAERVADEVAAVAGDTTEKQIRERAEASPAPGQAVRAAAATPGAEKAPATLVEAAKQVAGSTGETREALEQAIQKATNPEQQGAADPATQEPLDLLREAILHRMKPFQAVDARLFLLVNHMPHTPLINRLMYAFTLMMSGGWGWVLGLVVAALIHKRRGRQALLQIVPPLWFATMTVEYPIKYYFRRKRPFIDVVQAVAIGRKPGSFSFPSGHSASAFAGAWLLRRHYPKLAPLWYAIAALTGFSRVYLGVHYPGDVLSGALAGTVLAEATRWAIDEGDEPIDANPLRRAFRRWFG
jgi:membrane-associated phospholipid phosphatase